MRVLARVLAPIMLALGLLVSTGCTPEEIEAPAVAAEDQVREEVGRALDGVKGADEATVRALFGSRVTGLLDSLGLSPEPLWRAAVAHFSYEIESVDVSGDVAEVRVRATNVDVGRAAEAWEDTLEGVLSDGSVLFIPERLSSVVQGAMDSLVTILEAPDAATVTDTVTLVMTRGSDGWQPPSPASVSSVVFAGQDIETLADVG